jgi:serine/threonine protein kinase
LRLKDKICNANFEFPHKPWSSISEEAKDFIHRLLMVNPTARLTAEQALKHPWIVNEGDMAAQNTIDLRTSMELFVKQRHNESDVNTDIYNQ